MPHSDRLRRRTRQSVRRKHTVDDQEDQEDKEDQRSGSDSDSDGHSDSNSDNDSGADSGEDGDPDNDAEVKTGRTAESLNVHRKSGVYVLSYQLDITKSRHVNSRKRWLVKVGHAASKYLDVMDPLHRTSGLCARLDSYLLYYPDGYSLLACYTTSQKNALVVERALQSFLKGKRRHVTYPHSHTEEWFLLTHTDIVSACALLERQYGRTKTRGGSGKLISRVVVSPRNAVYMGGSTRKPPKRVSAMSAKDKAKWKHRTVPNIDTHPHTPPRKYARRRPAE